MEEDNHSHADSGSEVGDEPYTMVEEKRSECGKHSPQIDRALRPALLYQRYSERRPKASWEGTRKYSELQSIPEEYSKSDAPPMIQALFPRKRSHNDIKGESIMK